MHKLKYTGITIQNTHEFIYPMKKKKVKMSKLPVITSASFPKNLQFTFVQNQKENPGTVWDERLWFFLKVRVIGT